MGIGAKENVLHILNFSLAKRYKVSYCNICLFGIHRNQFINLFLSCWIAIAIFAVYHEIRCLVAPGLSPTMLIQRSNPAEMILSQLDIFFSIFKEKLFLGRD